ncbi:MAG: response regulator [Thermodesulfovibrionales bacterium]
MKNLLLVDDERVFLMSLSESLRQSLDNINVITAENGEEAIKILDSMPVDFVVTDLQMPVLNGFGVLSHLKEFYPSIPVLVMTAYVNDETMKRLSSLGFLNIMEKPIEFEDVIQEIRERI